MEKVALITGATGLLGRQVLAHFEKEGWKTTGTSLTRSNPPSIVKLDVTDDDAVEKLLSEVKPLVVVHCAADRFPDSCNAHPDAARKLNATSSANLAATTYQRGIFLIYISTDYVFPGRRGEAPYKSNATPEPTNIYGQTKLEGEQGVLKVALDATAAKEKTPPPVVLRVPVLYGPTPEGDRSQSVVNAMVSQIRASVSNTREEAERNPKVKMDHYAQRFPTNTEDVARVCFDIANAYLTQGATNGKLPRILQFSGEEKFTKYEMCQLLADILGLPLDGMEPDQPEDTPGAGGVQRPYDCHLDTSDLREVGIDVEAVKFETWWRRELRAFRH